MPDARFFLTAPPLTAIEAAGVAGAVLRRDGNSRIDRAASPADADIRGAVVFAEGAEDITAIGKRPVALCLTTEALATKFAGDGALAVTAAPRLGFARLAAALHRSRPFDPAPGPRPSKLGASPAIHPSAVIAESAEIGDRVSIGPGAAIGPGTIIGDDCAIGAGAVVTHAILGKRVALLAGAVIGEAGFGFVPGPDGPTRMPQLGRVIIGDDVEIGANSCVDRGALGDTVIGAGVKIDNLVQIGHNVVIGPMTVIAAQTGISGSVRIGAGVLMGGQVGVAQHLEIGDGAQLAAQSGVMRNVPPGEKWAGAPAKPAKVWFREITLLARLTAQKKQGGHE